MCDLALASAQRIKQQADRAAAQIEPARQKIAAGQRKVADFDRQITERRTVVQRAYDDATAKLRAAETDVNNKQAEVNRLQREIDKRKRRIDQLDNSIIDSLKNAPEITRLGIEIAGFETARGTASGVLELAKKTLAGLRSTVKAVPPELDPELSGLISARELTSKGIIAAQGTLQLAQQALGTLG